MLLRTGKQIENDLFRIFETVELDYEEVDKFTLLINKEILSKSILFERKYESYKIKDYFIWNLIKIYQKQTRLFDKKMVK